MTAIQFFKMFLFFILCISLFDYFQSSMCVFDYFPSLLCVCVCVCVCIYIYIIVCIYVYFSCRIYRMLKRIFKPDSFFTQIVLTLRY